MSIRIICPSCGETYNVSDELRGKKIRCKNCREAVAVGGAKNGRAHAESVQDLTRRPVAASAARKRFRNEEDDDGDDAPVTKKKAGSRALLFAVCGMGLAVVAVGAVLLVLLLQDKPDGAPNEN